ncbi:MAG TPA: hypothetical protein VK141_02630 [Nitrosomonas sp.]|nr:hypothetical protein [Nitrosomonas sp.]
MTEIVNSTTTPPANNQNLSTGSILTISDADAGQSQFQTTGITASTGALSNLKH